MTKAPLLGALAGLALLAVAWGVKALNPIVRLVLVLTGAVVILTHSKTVIAQIKGAWRQL